MYTHTLAHTHTFAKKRQVPMRHEMGDCCAPKTADDKPVMKAVIGTTFKLGCARPAPVRAPPPTPPPPGLPPKSFPNVRQIKTKHADGEIVGKTNFTEQ